jgi:hypothetical protein
MEDRSCQPPLFLIMFVGLRCTIKWRREAAVFASSVFEVDSRVLGLRQNARRQMEGRDSGFEVSGILESSDTVGDFATLRTIDLLAK